MVEGQNGLDWGRWQRLAVEVEALGFAGLYRSDHYTGPAPPNKESLELWLSLVWLADHSTRLRFGPIVSPVTFRHPALTARMAMQVDLLSNGRLTLGLGAGWQEREHQMFGLPLLEMKERFDRFAEALEVVTKLVRTAAPVTFRGQYYELNEAVVLPRPAGRDTPILIGGNGERRTLPLVARYADEWNAVMIAPARFRTLNARLDALLRNEGRDPAAVRRSLMHGITYGRDPDHLQEVLAWRASNWSSRADAQEMRDRGEIVGAGGDVVAQIEQYEAAGVQCLMLQWLPVDDVDALRHFASTAARWLRAT